MLIILSGSETIHKKFYARNILAHFIPDFEVDGYTVNFRAHPYEVKDSTGKTVYRQPQFLGDKEIHTLLLDESNGHAACPDGAATFEKIQQIYTETLLSGVRDNHFQNIFVDIESDYGVRTDPGYEWEEKVGQFIHPHTYEDVLNNYRNRRFPIHVITGSFSKTFVDKIRQDLGAENVKAYNLVRHPSAMFVLHEKHESYYEAKPPVTPETDDKKVHLAVVNCSSLARADYVTTIMYEDVLKQGYIEIEGEQVGLPEGYENYNDLITTWEKTHADLEIVTPDRLEAFNNYCSTIRSAANVEYGADRAVQFPENIFTQFGYSPLTREQVVAPKE